MRKWYRWLDWLLELPLEMDKEIWRQIDQQTKEKTMPYVTFADRYARELGKEEGERLGLLKGLRLGLKLKFGEAGLALMPDLERQEKLEALQAVFDAIESAASLDDLRNLLPASNNGAAT